VDVNVDMLAARRRRRGHVLDVAAAEVVLAVELLDLLDDHPDLVHSVTPEGRFLFANRAWCAELGYDRVQLQDLSVLDVVDPADHGIEIQRIAHALSGAPLPLARTRLRRRNGEPLEVEGSTVLHFMSGQPVGTITIMRPVARTEDPDAEATGP
jgi:PAS domain S-box-containing protein